MSRFFRTIIILVSVGSTAIGCKSNIHQQEDKIYSRRLQKHINLTIFNTPVPGDKGNFNLLILLDGQDASKLHLKEMTDSLFKKKLLKPLVVVGVHANEPIKEYGVSGLPDYKQSGEKADKFAAFIMSELYFYAKKKAGVRKFSSVCIAGFSRSGPSAVDIAWDNADKIDKVAVFSGAFGISDTTGQPLANKGTEYRILHKKIQSSRKKPSLSYWMYAGGSGKGIGSDNPEITHSLNDTRELIDILNNRKISNSIDIVFEETIEGNNDHDSWKKTFPDFLIWAFGQ